MCSGGGAGCVCYLALDMFLNGKGPGSILARTTLFGEKKNN